VKFTVDRAIRAYKIGKAANTVVQSKRKLERAFEFHQKGSDTLLSVAETAGNVLNEDVTGEDVRKVGRFLYAQRGRAYSAIVKAIKRRKKPER